jgi:Transposase DDE domain
MSIVGQTKRFVTTRILSLIKPKHQQMFSFGLQALTLTPYESLGSNARLVVENLSTASSKIYRLVSSKTLLVNFHRLVRESGLVKKTSLVNIDFSTFCGFQALCFGVQTGEGRALPVWNASITYPIKFVGSQNIFVLEQLKAFGACLGFYPGFVFDRGFWIPCVMKFLLRNNIMFYLRIKKGQQLYQIDKGKRQKAVIIGKYTKDATITLFGYKLRLVVSPPPPKQTDPKKKQNTERWYILTNDLETNKDDVLEIYDTRFEIEETFKDHKHIQKLKILRIRKIETFTILLWFASLAQWLAWWIKGVPAGKKGIQVNQKKKRSFFRIFWEELQFALRIDGLNRVVDLVAPG